MYIANSLDIFQDPQTCYEISVRGFICRTGTLSHLKGICAMFTLATFVCEHVFPYFFCSLIQIELPSPGARGSSEASIPLGWATPRVNINKGCCANAGPPMHQHEEYGYFSMRVYPSSVFYETCHVFHFQFDSYSNSVILFTTIQSQIPCMTLALWHPTSSWLKIAFCLFH